MDRDVHLYNDMWFQHSNSLAVIALSVSINPSRFAISWFSSSVECDGWSRWISSAVWGGGLDWLIRDGGVEDADDTDATIGSFLYGEALGRTVTDYD